MLTMMGLARSQPIKNPCNALVNPANASAAISPKAKPPQLAARMKTIAVAPTSAPSANDMIFPLIVISVMPTATHPIKETVVNSERILGWDKKPGVVRATAARTTRTTARTMPT